MYKRSVLAALLWASVAIFSPAFGQSAKIAGYDLGDFETRTTASLVNICTIQSGHSDYLEALSFCYGFFAGGGAYHNGLVAVESYNPIVCAPPKATISEAVDIFVAFAKSNPQTSEWRAMRTIVTALAEQWPCKK
ncbi:MAG: Rap1a/Tai family immunity protein [Kiloniellales bacterium]|nr:Rap1a/Tai family immunity protein [Kiloniellales bacterium]